MSPDEESKQAKIAALRNLRDKGFYEPETDNPEGLDLDSAPATPESQPAQAPGAMAQNSPQNTMQQDPQNLMDALKQKSRQQQLQQLMDAAKQ